MLRIQNKKKIVQENIFFYDLLSAICPQNLYKMLGTFALTSMILVGQNVCAQEAESKNVSVSVTWKISGITSRTERILSNMSNYLASAEEFTFRSDVTYDSIFLNDQKLQFGGGADIAVHRPNRLRVEYRGDERETQVVYDGKKFTILNRLENVYTSTNKPTTIDKVIDHMMNEYGVSVPVADLVSSDPYKILTENAESGFFVGQHDIAGVKCDHLAFTQQNIDWQIWIESGPNPVPRKLLITYKEEPGSPQYVATFSKWNFQPRISTHFFTFRPPVGSDEITFLPKEKEQSEVKP